ncbi:MAG: molecular chaperone DnaJ [Deltaproteobacteria bacterium RIFOXYA12_FULL_61_11]|nr:MAG: molecular chaperone DnaJ [Deltaproteobacteria bacterium RIFOXYA12_FULL_61_11]
MAKRDYYDILGLDRTCDEGEIKKAYRKMAMQFHPDRNPGDSEAEARFKEAAEAYEVLRDTQKRRLYDQYGHEGLSSSGFHGFSDVSDIFSSFGDLFEDFFGFGGRGRSSTRSRRGADLRQTLTIDFTEAAFGTSKDLEVERSEPCETCSGSGAKPGTSAARCTHCGGTGQLRHAQGFFTIATVCAYCRGTGKVIEQACKTCRGQGVVQKRKRLSVKVPRGVDSGLRLRLPGEGDPSSGGGPPGDLYIDIEVQPHELFERQGEDLVLRLPISFVQAALGAEVEIPTLEQPTMLTIPRGTQSGEVVRVPGQGFYGLRGNSRGELLVQLLVKTPTRLTKRQEELLVEFAQEGGENPDKKKSLLDKTLDFFEKSIH